MTTNMR